MPLRLCLLRAGMRACRGPNRLMRMFGGQVFRRDLPQNLLADADARCFATATTNAGTGGYGVMACVRVTSLSPLEKSLYETGVR